ncbi:TetR/AcrR family transcriptional regulator [Nesterenkonia rhizosphaerae]|uniref:TetR/AcrR family transcriptional regulator n=1 Tax=Nesterenkonia rhizosphaerae TaxID=1348272 RepID=A0ABP9FYF6_9MICC
MPKIVDREERRREIVDTYLQLVGRDGFEKASSRALAAELGVASGALWHYFDGFDEVLLRAFQQSFANTNARIKAKIGDRSGLAALIAMLEELFPQSKTTHDEAYVALGFWGRVPGRPQLRESQLSIERQWHQTITGMLTEAAASGELLPGTPADDIADTLLVLTTGYQVEHVLHTPVAQPSRQWSVVRHCLRAWMTEQGRIATGLDQLAEPA